MQKQISIIPIFIVIFTIAAAASLYIYHLVHAATVVVAHPVAQGNWITFKASGCGENLGQWNCVNDQSENSASGPATADDGNRTFVNINGGAGTWKDSYRLGNSLLPFGATVTQLVVTARAAETRAGGPDPAIRLFYRANNVDVPCLTGGVAVSGTTYVTVSCTFSQLNLTQLPEIGIEELNGKDLSVTQVYAEATYE